MIDTKAKTTKENIVGKKEIKRSLPHHPIPKIGKLIVF
jgi:hypothetical protein